MHKSLEVITPAACMDMTVLATAKMELGIADADTSQDLKIAGLIKQASGIVSDYCGQVFGQETVAETFWSDTSWEWVRSYMLARGRVTEIISVVVDDILLDPGEYRMSTDGHLHRVNLFNGGVCWWNWSASAVITYKAGYVLLDDLPYGLEKAVLSLIREFKYGMGRDPKVRQEEIPGVRNVTYWIGGSTGQAPDLPPDVVAFLRPYRRMVFA